MCEHMENDDGYEGGTVYRYCAECGGAVGADGYYYIERDQAPGYPGED